jgi:hypothetical protein
VGGLSRETVVGTARRTCCPALPEVLTEGGGFDFLSRGLPVDFAPGRLGRTRLKRQGWGNLLICCSQDLMLKLLLLPRSLIAAQVFGRTFSLSISDVIAVAGILLAIDQYRKNRSASRAVRQLKRSLLKQRSSQYFEELSRKAATLSSTLRSRNWAEVAELATQIGGLISSAASFSQKLILDEERNELHLAATSLKAIWEGIPANPQHQDVTDDKIKELMSHCMVIVYGVDRVGGRMRYLGELEEEDQTLEENRWWKRNKAQQAQPIAKPSPSGESR